LYAFFETFGVIDAQPKVARQSTTTLVYKVFDDWFCWFRSWWLCGINLLFLMGIVGLMTVIQFRFY